MHEEAERNRQDMKRIKSGTPSDARVMHYGTRGMERQRVAFRARGHYGKSRKGCSTLRCHLQPEACARLLS